MYPSLGSFWAHVSGCDPVNYGEAQGGRPSGFDKGGPAPVSRVATDPKRRQTYMIQWLRPRGEREWTPFPSDKELHEGDEFLWESCHASSSSSTYQGGASPSTSSVPHPVSLLPQDEEE